MSTTATKPRRRIEEHRQPVTLAMCAPAVRCVVVHVWASRPERWATTRGPDANGDWPDEAGAWEADDHEIMPVVALVASHAHTYARQAGDRRRIGAPTPEAMEAAGWRYEETPPPELDAVIHSTDYGGLCLASVALPCANTAHRLVMAPWDPSEDAERLRWVVDELRSEARRKVKAGERPAEKANGHPAPAAR